MGWFLRVSLVPSLAGNDGSNEGEGRVQGWQAGQRFQGIQREDPGWPEEVGSDQEQVWQDRVQEGKRCGQKGIQSCEGLDRSGSESTDAARRQGIRGHQKGVPPLQRGQSPLQKGMKWTGCVVRANKKAP